MSETIGFVRSVRIDPSVSFRRGEALPRPFLCLGRIAIRTNYLALTPSFQRATIWSIVARNRTA